MARDIDYNDPKSWDDDDKVYLKDRLDRVPEEHRHLLADPAPTFAPAATADTAEMNRLREFLEHQYPDEMAAEGQTPVGLAIQLLGADVEPDEDDDPGYEKWKADELTAEIAKRRDAGREIPKVSNKTDAAAALRADDATK